MFIGSIYPISLQSAGFATGLALVFGHLAWLLGGGTASTFLKEFPRSLLAGRILITVDALWAFWLVATMDLGEFSHLRKLLMVAVPVGWFLTIRFVDDFLAVRALGILALLAAAPLLDSAFLRPENTRLALVILAYAWIVAGIFWIGLPYLLRDQIAWVLRSPTRAKAACIAGLAYGLLLLGLAFGW